MNKFLSLCAVLVFCGGAVAAHADEIDVTLNTGLGCATLACGTIKIVDNGSGGVTVTENLINGTFFVVTGNGTNHDSISLDLDQTPGTVHDFSSLPTGLSWITGADPTPSGYHNFDYDFYTTLSNCSGSSCPPVTTLSFTIDGVSADQIDLASPITSDINDAGATGEVSGIGTLVHTPTVPEPSSLALLGTGALGLAGVVRRRFGR